MKTVVVCLIAVLGLMILSQVLAAPPTTPAQGPAPAAERLKWEYGKFSYGGETGFFTFRAGEKQTSGNDFAKFAKDLGVKGEASYSAIMDALGAEGWELVVIDHSTLLRETELYFKRRRN